MNNLKPIDFHIYKYLYRESVENDGVVKIDDDFHVDFNISRRSFYYSLNRLKVNGFLFAYQTRNNKGRFSKVLYRVQNDQGLCIDKIRTNYHYSIKYKDHYLLKQKNKIKYSDLDIKMHKILYGKFVDGNKKIEEENKLARDNYNRPIVAMFDLNHVFVKKKRPFNFMNIKIKNLIIRRKIKDAKYKIQIINVKNHKVIYHIEKNNNSYLIDERLRVFLLMNKVIKGRSPPVSIKPAA